MPVNFLFPRLLDTQRFLFYFKMVHAVFLTAITSLAIWKVLDNF